MDERMSDHLEDMVCDVSEENFRRIHLYDSLKFDSKEELYPCVVVNKIEKIKSTLSCFPLNMKLIMNKLFVIKPIQKGLVK